MSVCIASGAEGGSRLMKSMCMCVVWFLVYENNVRQWQYLSLYMVSFMDGDKYTPFSKFSREFQ